MKLGIVGHEAAKFTVETEALARRMIVDAILDFNATEVVSGHCHLGGIDIWAVEQARVLGVAVKEFPPKSYDWENGYKPRNIQIAERSDVVLAFVIDVLPASYKGMRFPLCYHCGKKDHVKSGGCWTAKLARGLGKQGETRIIRTQELNR